MFPLITSCKSYAGDVNAKVQPVAHHIKKQNNKRRCEFFLVVNLNSIVDIDLTTKVEDEEEVVNFDDEDDNKKYQDDEKEQMKKEILLMKERLREMERNDHEMDSDSYTGRLKVDKVKPILTPEPEPTPFCRDTSSIVQSPEFQGRVTRLRKSAKSLKSLVGDFDSVNKTIVDAVLNMNNE